MNSGIYSIKCSPTGQQYIGTALHWEKRVTRHIGRLRKGTHKNVRLQEMWQKHGETQFEFKLLETCSPDRLLEREKYWVSRTNSDVDGFNTVHLGSNGMLTHGKTHTGVHKSWESMKQRCLNPNSPDYHRYGALGIKMCERWLSFDDFYADMGDRPPNTSLDRYPDKNGNYEPTNCRWATPAEQQRNLRNNQYLTIQGKTKLLIDWAREMGIPVGLLRIRANRGITGTDLFAKSYSSFKGVKDADGNVIRTKREPNKNLKRYKAHGKELTLAQWAVELGVSKNCLHLRLKRYKMSPDEALVSVQFKRGPGFRATPNSPQKPICGVSTVKINSKENLNAYT